MTRRALILLCVAIGAVGCTDAPEDAIRLASSTLPLGLVAHYSFDEGSGATIGDHSGNRRDATMTGGTWLADGRFGSALYFASGQMASVNGFPDAAAGFSVSSWVRIHEFTQTTDDAPERFGTVVSTEVTLTGGWEVMLDRNQTTPAVNFAFWRGPNQGDFNGWTIAGVPLGQWTHVAAIVDENAQILRFYVDGVERGAKAITQRILPGSPTLTMGQFPAGGRDLNGDVDEIAIWSRVLAPAEIEYLHDHALVD